MWKRPSVRYGKTPELETPYQRAGQAWDDRIGSARVQARNWRLMALGQLALVAGLSAALVWQGTRGTVVPWIVEVDRTGRAVAVSPAERGHRASDQEIAWHLARFIEQVRSVPVDPIVLRHDWLSAYDFTTDRGAIALNDFARVNDPFSRVGKEQVAVNVSSVIRASPDSFRVAWSERRYTDGQLASTETWTAILTVVIQPPTDAEALRKNPLGIYVHAINWSREMGQ